MPVSYSSLSKIPTCYATVSISHTKPYTLDAKLEAISSAGFKAVELGFPDLLEFAKDWLDTDVKEDEYDKLCVAAEEVKSLCQVHDLKILVLQPFSNFEGWEPGSDEQKDALARAHGWISIMKAVGTDMLQVGSSDSFNITSDRDRLASDLRHLADLLRPHGFRLAYENWCWATHCPTLSDAWEIVQLVNRSNIGLCLDTFQIAGSEWADPTTEDGLVKHDGLDGLPGLRAKFHRSLAKLSTTIPADKIYFLQISDAYQPVPPMKDKVVDGLRPRGRWSHDFRPLPFEEGYLPVTEVTRAVLETGFRGWFSYEAFDGGKDGKGLPESREADLMAIAKRAMVAQRELLSAAAQYTRPSEDQMHITYRGQETNQLS
ncbi:hypothetical protein MMC12_007724 [Toensbergia leucococca]|nr:hypothetical protein [Toensbergia leucococca]